jgi:hypothetical protein
MGPEERANQHGPVFTRVVYRQDFALIVPPGGPQQTISITHSHVDIPRNVSTPIESGDVRLLVCPHLLSCSVKEIFPLAEGASRLMACEVHC